MPEKDRPEATARGIRDKNSCFSTKLHLKPPTFAVSRPSANRKPAL
jgi:hypothetical protein